MTRFRNLFFALVALVVLPQAALAGQFKPAVYYKVGTLPYSIVTADFNHDGNLDLAVSDLGSNQVSILLGKGDDTFRSARTFSVPSCAGLAVGDFNEDGIPDLVIVEYAGFGTGALGIYLGNGDGTFQAGSSYALGPGTVWLAATDFNGDGHLDVAAANSGSDTHGTNSSVMVLFGRGDGTFGKPMTYKLPWGPFAIAAADLNGDCHPDIAVTEGSSVAILMNTGGGKFQHTKTYAAGFEPFGVTIAPLKRDGRGHQDLVVSCYKGVGVFLGNGDGTFGKETIYSTSGIGVGPSNAVVADFNGDGNPDIAAALFNGNSALLYGRGDGTFKAAVPIKIKGGEMESLVTGDFANHHAPDLAIPGSTANRVAVFINSR
jgi:VCBS repeat protein